MTALRSRCRLRRKSPAGLVDPCREAVPAISSTAMKAGSALSIEGSDLKPPYNRISLQNSRQAIERIEWACAAPAPECRKYLAAHQERLLLIDRGLPQNRSICYRPAGPTAHPGTTGLKTNVLWPAIASLLLSAAADGDIPARTFNDPNKPVRLVLVTPGLSAAIRASTVNCSRVGVL